MTETYDAYAPAARYYDRVYHFKDYAAEATHLTQIVRELNPEARTLLDVACGTGKHLETLQQSFTVEGLDLSAGLLEVARERLPDVTFYQDDMTTFDLGKTYDVVTCLFGAVAYAETPERLNTTIARLAAHLAPGGVLLVELFLLANTFREGNAQLLCVDDPDVKVARMSMSQREGNVAILPFDYLITTPEGVIHLAEEHRLGLFSLDEYERAFLKVGIAPTFYGGGHLQRGLYAGVRG